MALPSTLHRFQIQLADSDRGVYQDLDLRVARHPSETVPYLFTRLFAYCLAWEEGIAFSSGLSEADEPALWVKDLTGRVLCWIDVGLPAPDRIHKAMKGVGRVTVFPHRAHELWKRQCEEARIHKAGEVRVVVLEPSFLKALESRLDRNVKLDVSVNHGHLFVTCGDAVLDTAIEELRFAT